MATLLRLLSILPKEIDIGPILEEAKRQLHREADYQLEAASLQQFGQHLKDDPRFELPEVVETLTTPEVLTMTYLDGQPIERLIEHPRTLRDEAATALLKLTLRELFEWGLVQTDPNFANYRYQPTTRRLQLLDFGATREFATSRRDALRALLLAASQGDDTDLVRAATAVGYIEQSDPAPHQRAIVRLVRAACEPMQASVKYEFGGSDLAGRVAQMAITLRVQEKFGRLPPTDVLFLHRKLGGLYLLFNRLQARISISETMAPFLGPASVSTALPQSYM